jgi:outer membrane protein insertion porin family
LSNLIIRTVNRFSSCAILVSLLITPVAMQAQQELSTGPILIDSVSVKGNVRLAELTVIAMASINRGSAYTIFDIQKATKELWASGQFWDITAHIEGDVGEHVTLVWEVEEQDLVRNVIFRGLVNADADEVQDSSGVSPGLPYSQGRVALAKDFIRRKLASKGIPFVDIVERSEPITNREKEVLLYFDVTEGTKITVADVIFEGNELFSDGDLRSAMSVKPEGFWWWRPGSYDRQIFDEDLAVHLPAHYAARGYLDFRVVGDSLIIDPTTGKTRIEVAVDEGVEYHVADFAITGNREFPTDRLERFFSPEEMGLFTTVLGDKELPVFDSIAFQAAVDEVGVLYQNEGYLYSQVVPYVNRNPVVEGEAATVNVGWTIREGAQAYIARVDIEGNEYTYDRIIRDKIFVLPGDVYSQERIIQSFQSISSLGYFDAPMDIPSIISNEDGDVDVTFRVSEKPTGAINFGTSVGGRTGVAGFVGYDQPNLFGKGKAGSIRWDFGQFANNQTMSYQDPGIFESLVSGSLNVFNARDRFISFQSGRRKRAGVGLRFGFPIPGARFTRFFAGYGLSRTKYTLQSGSSDQSLFGRPSATQSTISLGLTRSTMDHPLFPTVGGRQSLNMDFTGGPLAGDGKYLKTTADGSWWIPVGVAGGDPNQPGSGLKFALGMTFRAGSIQGNSQAFPFERFWMGGVQFGEQLRGYDETTVTPEGYFPEKSGGILDIDRLGTAFFSMTTELALRMGNQLSASVFFDAGNVWRNAAEFDPSRLNRGAGIGILLVTPFGPVGLDYAYGFDKPEPGWQLHFNLGGSGF